MFRVLRVIHDMIAQIFYFFRNNDSTNLNLSPWKQKRNFHYAEITENFHAHIVFLLSLLWLICFYHDRLIEKT